MRLLTEQEQIFSDKISVFRFDPAILGCFKLVRYGFLYLFDNLFVFPDTHVLSHFLQIFHREIVLLDVYKRQVNQYLTGSGPVQAVDTPEQA